MADRPVLFVHWLTLRHPLAAFRAGRPALPGQEVPGLGMLREAVLMLHRVAARLELEGLAVRPAWLHVAFAGRHHFRFVEAEIQGRFDALLRDLGELPLTRLSRAVADGEVLCDGAPYVWDAGLQVDWANEEAPDEGWQRAREQVCRAARFSLKTAAARPSGPGESAEE